MSSHGLETSALTDVVLPGALAVIMIGMGLSLTPADFRRIFRSPDAVLLGSAAQIVLLPMLGIAVAWAFLQFGLAPALAVGLVLLACCPGGATSNLVTYLARADAALAVTVTSVSSFISPFTTPLFFVAGVSLLGLESATVSVSLVEMGAFTALVIVVPILLGMGARRLWPVFAEKADRPFRFAGIAFLALVIAGVIAQNRDGFLDRAALTAPSALALNLLALGTGLGLGYLAKLGVSQSRAISIEVGFQNGTLGIAIAVAQLESAEAALVPGFYSLIMFLTGGLVAWWWAGDAKRRGFTDKPPTEAPIVVPVEP